MTHYCQSVEIRSNNVAMAFWLMKTEPEVFSIHDLKAQKKTAWEGVRNYQARNYMRDEMKQGDLVFIYHSNAHPSGIAGIGKIVSQSAYPDPTQFDPASEYHDAKSTPNNPRWHLVDVGFVTQFPRLITLEELKKHAPLKSMVLLQKGSRLSVQAVLASHWDYILSILGIPTKSIA